MTTRPSVPPLSPLKPSQRPAYVSPTVLVLIFCTGAAAMMNQVVWQRYLSRLLGCDAAATAVVLAAFLGGLSLGYWAFGRLARRVAKPFRAYALAEGFIGLWSLAFPSIFAMVESASAGLSLTSPLELAAQGFGLAVALIGPPTVCMGATAPLLTQALSRDLEASGPIHAKVYGINTAGAFLGAVAAGYVLTPELGLTNTLRLAACLNLLAAGWFALAPGPAPAWSQPDPLKSSTAPQPDLPATSQRQGYALMGLALLNGFQSMGLENALVRFVALSVGGSAYAFTMVVGVFVLAIAAGALLAGRFARFCSRVVWLNQALLAALLLLVYPTLDTWPYWAHRLRLFFPPTIEGFWAFQAAAFTALAMLVGAPAMLIGAAVPLIFNRMRSNLVSVGRLSGRILCANTIGNLSGSLTAGLLLHPALDNGRIFLLCSILALGGAWLASLELSRGLRWATGLAALAALALIPLRPWYEPQRFMVGAFREQLPLPYSHEPPEVFYRELQGGAEALFLEDGPECSVAVARTSLLPWSELRPLTILVNGKSDSSTVADMATLRLLAHLPALLAPSRERTLVIGLGTGVTSGELARYSDVQAIDTAEISSSVIKALPLFSDFTGAVHKDPRLRLLHGDAFRILARSDKRWDLIISEPSNPWTLGVDALFSREFYRLVKTRLTSQGLFVQWIHIHDASELVLGVAMQTLRSEFAHIRVFMSQENDLLLLASAHDLGDGGGPNGQRLEAASRALRTHPELSRSLRETGIVSLEALLAREIPLPRLEGPVQTLDMPVLHYLAGKSYFMGERTPLRRLLSGEELGERGLLERRVRSRPEGPLSRAEAESILNSAMDRRSEEPTPLPLSRQLETRLQRLTR